MSFGVGGAILGSAVIGGIASNQASKQNSKGVQKGLDQSAAISKQARNDVVSLFNTSAKRANVGIQEALNFYKQNAQKRVQPYVQANANAQNVIGKGAIQANNAILGLPVDMNQITNQPQAQADYSGIQGAQLPQITPGFAQNSQGQIVEPTAETKVNDDVRAAVTNIAPGITGMIKQLTGRR
jgi:hypothetical protein